MDVKSLNSDVKATIRSGYTVGDISHCINELVLNSIDANSRHIAVRVNLLTFRIEVVDDGEGITETNLQHVGKRYYTNKCNSLDDIKKISKVFGYKGEALASIINNSKLVKITTRSWNCVNTQSLEPKTFLKTFQGQKCSISETSLRISGGTTITVQDFLYNLPVRQKTTKTDFNEIRKNLQCIFLTHPKVAISLRDCSSKRTLFSSQIVDTIEDAMIQQLDNLDKNFIKYYSTRRRQFSVKILIYLKPHDNNRYQLFYVNKCPVKSTLLTSFVNDILLTSTIAGSSKREKKNSNFLYLINICCPHSQYQLINFDKVEFKRLESILKVIERQFMQILEKENIGSSVIQKTPKKEYSISKHIRLSAFPGTHKACAVRKKNREEQIIDEEISDINYLEEPKLDNFDKEATFVDRETTQNHKKNESSERLSTAMSSSLENEEYYKMKKLLDENRKAPKPRKSFFDNFDNNSTVGRHYMLSKFMNDLPERLPMDANQVYQMLKLYNSTNASNGLQHQSKYVNFSNFDSEPMRQKDIFDMQHESTKFTDGNDGNHNVSFANWDDGYQNKTDVPLFENSNNFNQPDNNNEKIFPSNNMTNFFNNPCNGISNRSSSPWMFQFPENSNQRDRMNRSHRESPKIYYPNPYVKPYFFLNGYFKKNGEFYDKYFQNQQYYKRFTKPIPKPHKTIPTFPFMLYDSAKFPVVMNGGRYEETKRKNNNKPQAEQELQDFHLDASQVTFPAVKDQPFKINKRTLHEYRKMPRINSPKRYPIKEDLFTTEFPKEKRMRNTPPELNFTFKRPNITEEQYHNTTLENFQFPENSDFTFKDKRNTNVMENKPNKRRRNVFFRKRASEKIKVKNQNRFGSNIKTSVTYSRITKISRRIRQFYNKSDFKNNVNHKSKNKFTTRTDNKIKVKSIKRNSRNLYPKFPLQDKTKNTIIQKTNKGTNTIVIKKKEKGTETTKKLNKTFIKTVLNRSIQCTLVNHKETKATDTNLDKTINVISNILVKAPIQDPNITTNNVSDDSDVDEIIESTPDCRKQSLKTSNYQFKLNCHNIEEKEQLQTENTNTLNKNENIVNGLSCKMTGNAQSKMDSFQFSPIIDFNKCINHMKKIKTLTVCKGIDITSNNEQLQIETNDTEGVSQMLESLNVVDSETNKKYLNISVSSENRNTPVDLEKAAKKQKDVDNDNGLFDLSVVIDEIVSANNLVKANEALNEKNIFSSLSDDAFNNCFTINYDQSPKENDAFKEWSRRVDSQGGSYYINRRTGNTMNRPTEGEIFHFIEKLTGCPKCFSPVLIKSPTIVEPVSSGTKREFHAAVCESYEDDLGKIKWKKHYLQETDPEEFFNRIYDKRFQFGNIADLKFPKPKSTGILNALAFTKDMFQQLDILQQYDHKFIVATWKPKAIIVVFDQHAAHERIRLEQLQKVYRNEENGHFIPKKLKEFAVILTRNVATNCYRHADVFLKFGIEITSIDDNFLKITSVPDCLFNKVLREPAKRYQKLLELTKELLYEIENSLFDVIRSDQWMPPLLINLINSEACRSAIMFGDALTIEECGNLIKDLSSCNLPFQCAHGRPTCAPVMELVRNAEKIQKINLKRLKVFRQVA